jgi:hypothetical protein
MLITPITIHINSGFHLIVLYGPTIGSQEMRGTCLFYDVTEVGRVLKARA